MIPLRISLKGFLCYKEEQEITFDSNASLWMLSGLNGSGKSSIFDAVTYSLFGSHRGGSQHAVELINKDSDGLAVEFDFRLDSQVYRVRRTLRRTSKGSPSSTQQIYRYQPNGGKHDWLAIEGSNYKRQFEEWIGEKIGLNYDTFTSSVLLLQGKAEKLLGSKPEDRRAVLASIVDLERYERLHEKADAKRKELKGKLDGLSDRLGALREVKAEEIAAAEEAIRIAEEARQQAGEAVEQLHEMERQAKNWMELQGKLAAARQRWQRAEQLIEKSANIERDLERLRALREVLPRLREIIKQRGTIRDAELTGKDLLHQKEKVTEQLARHNSALNQTRGKRTALQQSIEADEKKQRELNPQLIALTAQMVKLENYERESLELEGIIHKLAPLPADAAAEVKQARAVCDRLAALAQFLPLLTRFQEQREAIREAREREQGAKRQLAEVETHGKQLKAELDRLGPLVKAADTATRQAKDQETKSRTLVEEARKGLREITELDGSKRCRHCGQELTPGHVQEEKHRRAEALRQAEKQLHSDAEEWKKAYQEEQRLRTEAESANHTYLEARDAYRETHALCNRSSEGVDRLQGECARIYGELAEEQRQRISSMPPTDWLTTEYPTWQDLEELRTQAADYAATRQRLRKAEETWQQWNTLKTQESGKRATLERLRTELPADREAVRSKHTDLTLRGRTLESDLKTKRAQLKEAEDDMERLLHERDHSQGHINRLDLELKKKEVDGQKARELIAVNQKSLLPSWQMAAETAGAAEYSLWDKERTDLEASGVEQRGQELQHAQIKRDEYRRDVEDHETQLDNFAPEARRDPADIKVELERAREAEKSRKAELNSAERHCDRLKSDQEERRRIGEDMIRWEGEYSLHEKLAELLGRNRLQLHLVRQAEKQVVEYGNAVLDRLSGGQLYLKLRGEAEGEGNSGKALELEAYNRVTGERPINVAFLSGSQKFRVAVSLALGIGQYASRQHRPIESVIIDEGFGCLDSQGRQVMIQELQNLRSQMRCILLVSHQEDFAEAFSDGYRFELENGSTRITPLRK